MGCSVTAAELLAAVADELEARRVRSTHTFPDKIPAEHLQLLGGSGAAVEPDAMAMAFLAKTDVDVSEDGEIVASVRVRHMPPPEPITVRFGPFEEGADVLLKQMLPLEHIHVSIPEGEISTCAVLGGDWHCFALLAELTSCLLCGTAQAKDCWISLRRPDLAWAISRWKTRLPTRCGSEMASASRLGAPPLR